MIISGKIKEEENGRRHRNSRRTGRFEYLDLPAGDVKANRVSAQLAAGVLNVTEPKSEAYEPGIEVKAVGTKS